MKRRLTFSVSLIIASTFPLTAFSGGGSLPLIPRKGETNVCAKKLENQERQLAQAAPTQHDADGQFVLDIMKQMCPNGTLDELGPLSSKIFEVSLPGQGSLKPLFMYDDYYNYEASFRPVAGVCGSTSVKVRINASPQDGEQIREGSPSIKIPEGFKFINGKGTALDERLTTQYLNYSFDGGTVNGRKITLTVVIESPLKHLGLGRHHPAR